MISNETINNEDIKNLVDMMKINFSYPDPEDLDFQSKIYSKREYYYNKVPFRKAIDNYEDIKTYRDRECGGEKFQLQTQQSLLSNFINPDTPYKGLLVFHGVGTGKTCTAFAIAENFKEMVKRYNTKIHILVTGPLIREQWKNELVEVCAKETYLKDYNQTIGYLDEVERNKAVKQAKLQAMQFYKILSFRSFQKKVLGQKIIERKQVESGVKSKKKYRKNIEGEIERDIAIDKIDSLNNTLLIIDEAHNLTGNEYGDAVKKIIQNSKNLRVLLLTATPMKNLGDDIIELINLMRPLNTQIERDKVFTGMGHLMEFKQGGKDYLRKMVNGYVSHFRGANPLTFADSNELGEVPPGLNFTKVTRCFMDEFQLKTYENILELTDDTLDRRSQSVANFVFPALSSDKVNLEGLSGEEGINNIRNQIKANKQLILNKINDYFFDGKYPNPNELLVDNEKKKTLGGKIFKLPYLKFFSIKFYTCLNNINENVIDKKGPGTIFVYSNLVKVGIELFREVLIQNGYLEFSENKNYNIQDDTVDSLTGFTYREFIEKGINIQQFHPATFITFTGKTDDTQEDVPEAKILVLKNHFNNINNKDGKYIKIVLGSRVMNEGITLYNIKEVHLLDVYYNFGRVHQVIGRAIRRCVHYKITNDQNPFPQVNIYKYVVSLPPDSRVGILSAEEELYQKAEYKYILVKDIERVIKEASIDCPLNYNGNIFPEEVNKYKDCITPQVYGKLTFAEKETAVLCPAACDFQKCEFKCFDKKLNEEFFDNEINNYRKIPRKELDYTTFTTILKRNEVNYVKEKIKELFKYKYVYVLDELESKVRLSYTGEKSELFDEYFVHQALNELIPLDENDFNNFQDTVYDKYNKPGYLIYRNKYYIFQPFDQNEDVPMWYRSNYQSELYNDLTIYNFMKNSDSFKSADKIINIDVDINSNTKSAMNKATVYDFSNMEYYNNKNEFIYVGIIDKGSTRIKSIVENKNDVFKLRPSREKILIKKRGTGIPSLKGAVCNTSKDKNLLIKIAKEIGVENIDNYIDDTRFEICQLIRDRLLFLEKFSTDKDKNKYVYMIIPTNHQTYQFPLNLEDRIKYIIDQLQSKISISLTYKYENIKNGIFEGVRNKNLAKYKIILTNKKDDIDEYKDILSKNGFVFEDKEWSKIIE
jgi:superfamily II DNA or RNA helicase